MTSENTYWGLFVGLFILGIVFDSMDPCKVDEEVLGICEYNGGLLALSGFSCLGSFLPLGLAINLRRQKGSSGGQTVIINKTPAQRVHSPPVIIQQQPAVVNHPPPQYRSAPPPQRPAPMQEKSGGFADQRKQIHLDRAHKLEMEENFEGAITAYELAEEFREAQRVRWALGSSKKESSDNGPKNVNISIGKVGDTSVQDSVITGSDDET
jgi:hypothetical protein